MKAQLNDIAENCSYLPEELIDFTWKYIWGHLKSNKIGIIRTANIKPTVWTLSPPIICFVTPFRGVVIQSSAPRKKCNII